MHLVSGMVQPKQQGPPGLAWAQKRNRTQQNRVKTKLRRNLTSMLRNIGNEVMVSL